MTVYVQHRLSLSELATYITADLNTDLSHPLTDDRLNDDEVPNLSAIQEALPTKRIAMKIVHTTLRQQGEERAHYFVGDGGWNNVADAVEKRLNELWS